jgi:hypothetical protein
MNTSQFFVEQYDSVCSIADDLFLSGMSDDQMRHQPTEGLNSMVWYLWHTARWQDLCNTLIDENRSQILDDHWLVRMNIPRRDVGTGMTREECSTFNRAINVGEVRAYWSAVTEAVRDVARSLSMDQLSEPVDKARIYRMLEDGTIANERAGWLPSFLEPKNKGWFLSMAVWHSAEHLLGGVACVRRVSGIPIGL